MSEHDTDQKVVDENGVERHESGQVAEAPEPSDEQKEEAKRIAESYVEDRPTTVLPGSDGTVAGTAINDWIDDEGNPVHGEVKDDLKEAAERDRERNRKAGANVGRDDDKAAN